MRITDSHAIRAALLAAAVVAGLTRADDPAWDLPAGPPCAAVDLTTNDGVALVQGQWRYSDARVVEIDFRAVGPDRKPSGPPNRTYDIVPKAGAVDFDDSGWEVIDPATLDERRSNGKVCFNWYRINLTVPDSVGDFRTEGATVVFEIVVDDYAEVWVDGRLPRDLGISGGPLVGGWNVPNRLVVARDVRPGRQIQVAVFGMNGPISDAPENYIWVRSARLEFFAEACRPGAGSTDPRIVRMDPRLDELIPPGATVERIADGFTWLEGPVWNKRDGSLLFSDIPANAVYRWYETDGVSLVLKPSGYSGERPFTGREPGSNGLTFDREGRLVLCQHGDRRIARLDVDRRLVPIADRFEGKRLNSPNDAVFASNGDLYFTDPPFGLPDTFRDEEKELSFSGVFRRSADGALTLLTAELTSPNGLALSPDERTLYVSNADAGNPVWMKYGIRPDGSLAPGRVLFSAAAWTDEFPGLPDGIKVDAAGNLFTAGPGGIYVFSPGGDHLGFIRLDGATSNCAFGGDGSELYITAGSALYRVKTTTRGAVQ